MIIRNSKLLRSFKERIQIFRISHSRGNESPGVEKSSIKEKPPWSGLGKKVGGEARSSTTFETGATDNSLDSAKEFIPIAAGAKTDTIKFQIFDPGRLAVYKRRPYLEEIRRLDKRQTSFALVTVRVFLQKKNPQQDGNPFPVELDSVADV